MRQQRLGGSLQTLLWCTGYAAVRQCDLQDMILSVIRLKEFVGRNLLAKPNLLGEMPLTVKKITITCTWGGGASPPHPPQGGVHEGAGEHGLRGAWGLTYVEEVGHGAACDACFRGRFVTSAYCAALW